ncbi:iron reductase domain protein [Lophiostoma macrostomum CBS 122681]|uniref:Iron reductase domain protein n=1 Tax=Lophiostoma macrostomum CBS 122681 TaxID=1314788 RepID=A0A6A6T8S9_9PLEO|nr:iron reductase domain protein [Lophiostoma macrostomum CBS 122681]
MARPGRRAAAATLLAFASHTSAQLAKVCATTDVCYQLNIPESTASSGSGDIFFQISAPIDYEWAALGQGTSMGGSNMFVVYTSADGKNVTVSPRTASGHNTPTVNGEAQVTLLEGSGVSNGKMIANVRCSNCNSWSGGTADFTASTGNWIHAFHSSGGPKNSDSQDASITQHDNQDTFQWDYSNAKGGSSVNPLLNTSPSGTGSAGGTATSCVPRSASGAAASGTTASGAITSAAQTTAASTTDGRPTSRPTTRPWGPPSEKRQEEDVNYCDDNGGDGSNSGTTFLGNGSSGGRGGSTQRMMLIAHGTLACLAFVIFFPAGAIAIRLASFPGVVWFHAAFQVFAYLVYIAAFGLGVYIASDMDLLDEYHPIIGIVVFIALFIQPIFGYLHHLMFKKYSHRTFWSYAHIWVGRLAITLGIINGGLGFKLADSMGMSSKPGMIAYSVIAGFVWLAWVASAVIGERRRKMTGVERPPKYSRSSPETAQRDEQHPINGHYAPAADR